MAHARLSGILREYTRMHDRDPEAVTGALDVAALPAAEDTEVVKKLLVVPETVERAARDRTPHLITVYLHDLATSVHGWYHRTRTVGGEPGVERARILLTRAARTVLANGLTLLGISAPDRM
jgi:arginyl-tRNA synthetase